MEPAAGPTAAAHGAAAHGTAAHELQHTELQHMQLQHMQLQHTELLLQRQPRSSPWPLCSQSPRDPLSALGLLWPLAPPPSLARDMELFIITDFVKRLKKAV